MKVFVATIVDEPENAPTVLLATSDMERLVKLKACSDLAGLAGLEDATTCDEVVELWEDQSVDPYAGIFLEEQEL